MKYFLCMLLLFVASILSMRAQDLFLKTYDFGTVEDSYQIIQYKGRIYINTATYCDAECSYLTEIDSTGAILWRMEIPDIDIASSTMVIVNDTITITGNNDPFNTAFRMAHFTLDGEKIGQTHKIEHPTKKYTRMFQLTTQYFNGKYVICGPGVQGDTSWSLIYVVNSSGLLDTLIALDPTNYQSDIWDSFIDKEGRLTTYHQIEFGQSEVNYRKIYKFDNNFDTVWTYTSELNDDNSVLPRGCELHDGRTILSFMNPLPGSRLIHSVRAINSDSTVDWQHNYGVTGSRTRYILRLKTLANGDIMGSGNYSELTQTPKINDSPWLFRMSPDGELLWERTYFDIDTNDMESRRGALFDFVELENGDIIAVGYFRYEDDDMLIMRVDSNGCLDSDDCHEVNILTKSNELQTVLENIILYPNPAVSVLNITCETNQYQLTFDIVDMLGQVVAGGFLINGQTNQNIKELNNGLYIVNLYDQGRLITSEKFVKIGE